MMKKVFLTAVAAAAIAVSVKAQTFYAEVGQAVAISSLVDANAQGGVTYEWYRNGVLIPGCNEATCLVPANLATGTDVKFHRRATALGCAIGNTSNTNAITITFCNVVTSGACWAAAPVSGWRTFAASPNVYPVFFQFNRTHVWPNSGVANVPTTAINENAHWHVDSSPCPDGWRLPTSTEQNELNNNSNPTGGTWAAANSRGNTVAGRFYGKRSAVCSLPDDMAGCVFFSTTGSRNGGGLYDQGTHGYYWSSVQATNEAGALIQFDNSHSYLDGFSKYVGLAVRCVK